jgi:hypothetical protein
MLKRFHETVNQVSVQNYALVTLFSFAICNSALAVAEESAELSPTEAVEYDDVSQTALADADIYDLREALLLELEQIKAEVAALRTLKDYQTAVKLRLKAGGGLPDAEVAFPADLCAGIEYICARLPITTQRAQQHIETLFDEVASDGTVE